MRASRVYELIVSRPRFLGGAQRLDRIEVSCLDDGEVVLYWELPPKRAARLLKALRSDLVSLEAAEFRARWENLDLGPDSIG
jgi:hypothetical protein